jgi:hypothetical protein
MASRKKIYHCKFCTKIFNDEAAYAEHIAKKHKDMIIPGMVPRQFVYYLRTGKTHGTCIVCKKDTKWNDKTNKYHRFCDNPKCKEEYRKVFKDRMIGKYGKVTLCDDPEQQKKMLAARKISGVYHWSDHIRDHVIGYTGSYELDFLQFMDFSMDYPFEDIMSPSPHTYYYMYEGTKHFYIPDFFIPSLDLEIEIKDGGDNPNTHPKIVAVDKEKERLKDEVLKSKEIPYNYLKITNKEYMKFFHYLEKAKEQEVEGITKKIFMP